MPSKISTILYIVLGIIAIACVYFFLIKKDTPTTTLTQPVQTVDESNIFTIVAFGDSLTAGYGVNLEDSYPSILENILKEKNIQVKILNMGVSGETTSGGLDRVQFVIDQEPDLVLLGLGANDMLRSSPPSLARSNLETILTSFKDKNIPVVLLGMRSVATNGATYNTEFNAIYPDLAKKFNLSLVPFFLEGVALRKELNTSDGIHPNRAGYEKIVNENILPILLPVLK